MSRALGSNGYEILLAADGREAIRILHEREVDAVLTDRKMPGMSGDELIRHIKLHFPAMPIAIITAYPEDAEDLDPDAILVKPFGERELRELARSLVEKEPA